jgi:hypothetical protein
MNILDLINDIAIDGTVKISDYLNEIMEQVALLQKVVTSEN